MKVDVRPYYRKKRRKKRSAVKYLQSRKLNHIGSLSSCWGWKYAAFIPRFEWKQEDAEGPFQTDDVIDREKRKQELSIFSNGPSFQPGKGKKVSSREQLTVKKALRPQKRYCDIKGAIQIILWEKSRHCIRLSNDLDHYPFSNIIYGRAISIQGLLNAQLHGVM